MVFSCGVIAMCEVWIQRWIISVMTCDWSYVIDWAIDLCSEPEVINWMLLKWTIAICQGNYKNARNNFCIYIF